MNSKDSKDDKKSTGSIRHDSDKMRNHEMKPSEGNRLYGNGKASRTDFPFDETKFLPGQREAAIKIVEREFTPKKERRNKRDLAEDLGVSHMTLYRWETRDQNFINFKNYIASDFVNSHLPFVYSKLIEGIDNGSMKGIELFLKRMGDLDNRSEVTLNAGQVGDDKTYDERKEDLMKRLNKSDDGGSDVVDSE